MLSRLVLVNINKFQSRYRWYAEYIKGMIHSNSKTNVYYSIIQDVNNNDPSQIVLIQMNIYLV